MRSIYLRDPDGNLIELCSYGEKINDSVSLNHGQKGGTQ